MNHLSTFSTDAIMEDTLCEAELFKASNQSIFENYFLSQYRRKFVMLTKSILLIESEANLREVLAACLSDFGGWRVIASNSIQKAIDLCIDSAPDAILLDASTSESDALLFIEQLKERSVSQSIPILLITERSSWFTLDQLQEMGFAGAITKPFTSSTLLTQIMQLLGWTNED